MTLRELAAQGLARRRVALAREQAVGRARLAARARARQRRRRPRARGRGARPVLRAQQPARRVGRRSGRGSTARASRGGDARVRRASTTRRRSSSTASEVAQHVGAFTPFRVDVPRRASTCSRSPCTRRRESEAQVGRTSRVRVHKSRMGYGWDFCPRLVHQGIWRPVTLDPPRERFPRVTLRGRRRHGRGRRRDRCCASSRRSSGGRTAWASSGSTRGGRLRRRLPHGRAATTTASSSTASRCRSAAGTGCRSTRSTACRGRRSSRACSSSPRARTSTCCACGAAA